MRWVIELSVRPWFVLLWGGDKQSVPPTLAKLKRDIVQESFVYLSLVSEEYRTLKFGARASYSQFGQVSNDQTDAG